MLTPQEISSRAFPKAVVCGYNMSSVDEFLDELTDDYTALYKENAALKAKMKVLVEKVEDYRATEDSMRATLLTAQKMADNIVKDAETKREQLMNQAETDAREKIGQMQEEVRRTQERLRTGRQELADFIANSRTVCQQQLAYLDRLPQLAVEQADPPPTAAETEQRKEETADEIEQNLYATFQQEEEAAAPAEEPASPQQAEPEQYPEGDPFAKEETAAEEPTRRIDLKDLKFGRNYAGEKD